MNAVMMSVLATFTLFVLFLIQGVSAFVISNTGRVRGNEDAPGDMVDPKLIFCHYMKFQAAFEGPDDKQYYFRVHEVFVVKGRTITSSPRKKIFLNSPYFVNAMVFSHRTGKAYLFKDRKVWIYQYRGNEFIYLQTKQLDRTTPNILDAAFYYRGFIYLQKDGFLYAWDEREYDVIPNHVFPVEYFWRGVPTQIDAAMRYEDDKTVFWKWQDDRQMQYYLFDNAARKLIKKGSFVSFFPFCAH